MNKRPTDDDIAIMLFLFTVLVGFLLWFLFSIFFSVVNFIGWFFRGLSGSMFIVTESTYVRATGSLKVSLVKNKTRSNDVQNIYIYCDSQDSAREQAKAMGLGLEPVLNSAHDYGQRDHYHLFDHCYLRYDFSPNTLYNYHFRFGDVKYY